MQPLRKYILLESSVAHTANQETTELWKTRLTEFVFNYFNSFPATLLSLNPSESNIGNDIGECVRGNITSKRYLISYISTLKRSLIVDLLEDSDFYLGHSLLIKGIRDLTMCKELLFAWDSYLLNTGQEFFRMGADGLAFYWYSPSNIDTEHHLPG